MGLKFFNTIEKKNQKYIKYFSYENKKRDNYFYGDQNSFQFLLKKNFELEKLQRYKIYKKIEKILNAEKIYPFFSLPKSNLFPWYFVINTNQKKKIYF